MKPMTRVLTLAGVLAIACFPAPASSFQSEDEAARLARSVLEKQKERPFWFHMRSILFGYVPYVFNVKATIFKYDSKGNVEPGCKTLPHGTGVFVPIEESLHYIPLEFCGNPVAMKTRKTWEQTREDKIAELKRKSDADKAKSRAAAEKQRLERAQFWDEFIKAFRFQVVERQIHNQRPTTRLSFTPMPGYRPGSAIDTKYLPKMRGQIWVDDADNEIAHIAFEFIENVTAGFGLIGKVSAGSSYSMDLSKQIEGQWLPARAETVLKIRALLVMKTNQRYIYEWGNYRKFSTDVRVLEP